uniref:DUF985 domain-containing protein n=1 Tax=Ganoderma boninense TaxID=34458 RepID=A0A5K1K461_9APHY|nr:Eukaryotic translation initiation factor 3 subunit G (eIF3g) (Eukaryotic translation initiation factor 3 RNA-binding subunit) (eIF-3 RNA-binding subunit) (Translation initiation factor eIF3 p33 subunit homolog) (eIF3 p33 homolog) [Ganoderma boninense]
MTTSPDYMSYTIPNSVLIKQLKMIQHTEGGFFAETDRQEEQVPSPWAVGKAMRPLATSIYYLLTPDEPSGVFHMNKSATMHVLHQGRAEYTLITPGTPPKVERKVMGPNIHAGEVLQLLVPTGVWKMSRLLPKDREAAASQEDGKECYGCLITEVVFPGFVWQDHAFLTPSGFFELFRDHDSPEARELIKHVKNE